MARKRARPPLNVFLNARLVGQLQREASGAIQFRYADEWLAWNKAIPVSLSMPLREDRYIGKPVFAVFDNLLPDNEAIRKRVSEKSKAEGDDAYNLLSAIGRDCVGALQFLPEGEDAGDAGNVEGRAVSDKEIATILGNLARNPLGIGDDEDFRISIAGAQEKTALLYWKKKWHVPHGTSATTHILKPALGKLDNGIDMSLSVENEHLCLELARAFGLPTAKTEMAEFNGKRVLVIERFDRVWTRDKRLLRIPQEDFCQALSVPGVSIRDLIFYNSRRHPFLNELMNDYGSRQIVFEMKNVAAIERGHIDQLNRYLKDSLGNFGALVTRNPLKKAQFSSTIDLWSGQRKAMICLTDADIIQMVEVFESKQREPLDVIVKKYAEFKRACP